MNQSETQDFSKLPSLGTTIFTVMSKMAQEFDAINLSQGFPDFEPPEALIEAFRYRLSAGHHQYPPMHGIPALRTQIQKKVARYHQVFVDPETEVTITSGATEAIFVTVQALVRQGDEVVIFDPAFDAYAPAVTLAGGTAKHLPLTGTQFEIDVDALTRAVSPRTRLLIINSPHNPCGGLIAQAVLEHIADLADKHDFYVLSDEVYEHMVFDGQRHVSAIEIPALRKRTFMISSFGKTLHATGWKVAYCVAPPTLTVEFRKIHQFVTFTTHTPCQWAIADFLAKDGGHVEALPAFYEKKRDLFKALFEPLGFQLTLSQGTYFQLANYSAIPALRGLTDKDCANTLTQKFGVAAIPISVFYDRPPQDQRLIRFCFAKDDETLRQAARRLETRLNERRKL
ncbi:MAG: methionine aminotransferase [Pseudomonadales bacterium]